MFDPVTLTVAAVAAGVAVAAGLYSLPTEPTIDAERFFKVALAASLVADAEDETSWAASVVRFVPFHPAGRWPEQKVAEPGEWTPPDDWLPGEQAVVEALAALETVAERWRRLYDTDRLGLEARLEEPEALGADYDPAHVLGSGASWDALMAWEPAFCDVLERRCPWRWAVVRGRPRGLPDVVGALVEATSADVFEPGEALGVALTKCVPHATDRLVVVGEGEGIVHVLKALHATPALRERVVAVVSIAGTLEGVPGEEGELGPDAVCEWLTQHFTHRQLDTEIIRDTPYVSLGFLDRSAQPIGAAGLPLSGMRFPEPADEDAEDQAIGRLDLGVLPVDDGLPVHLVARSLRALLAIWLTSQRG